MKRSTRIEIAASLFILLFLYTSVSKWLAFPVFVMDMNNQPFPNWMTPYLVWTLPFIEVFIAIALIFSKTQLRGFYASLFLMLAFTIYTVIILLHVFKRIPCSCGGVIKHLTWNQHLVFNLVFIAIAVAGIYWKKREMKAIA